MKKIEPLKTAYGICWKCKGSGLQNGLYDVMTCSECHGNCTVRLRDNKGKFVTKEVLNEQ